MMETDVDGPTRGERVGSRAEVEVEPSPIHAVAVRGSHGGTRYPLGVLIFVILASAVAIAVVWTALRRPLGVSDAVYHGGLLGLLVATVAHLFGTGLGAVMAPSKGLATAYLASTVVRFLCTPVLALSLYSALPLAPQPILVGSVAAYLLILVGDVAAMMRCMKRS